MRRPLSQRQESRCPLSARRRRQAGRTPRAAARNPAASCSMRWRSMKPRPLCFGHAVAAEQHQDGRPRHATRPCSRTAATSSANSSCGCRNVASRGSHADARGRRRWRPVSSMATNAGSVSSSGSASVKPKPRSSIQRPVSLAAGAMRRHAVIAALIEAVRQQPCRIRAGVVEVAGPNEIHPRDKCSRDRRGHE